MTTEPEPPAKPHEPPPSAPGPPPQLQQPSPQPPPPPPQFQQPPNAPAAWTPPNPPPPNAPAWTPPIEAPLPSHGPLAPPRTVKIASYVWTVLGVVLVLGAIAVYGQAQAATLSTGPAVPGLMFFIGVAFIGLARRMRRGGSGARIALTVLGCFTLIGIWTILLVVPAIVLQFRPSNNAWFRAVEAYRAPHPPQPRP